MKFHFLLRKIFILGHQNPSALSGKISDAAVVGCQKPASLTEVAEWPFSASHCANAGGNCASTRKRIAQAAVRTG